MASDSINFKYKIERIIKTIRPSEKLEPLSRYAVYCLIYFIICQNFITIPYPNNNHQIIIPEYLKHLRINIRCQDKSY